MTEIIIWWVRLPPHSTPQVGHGAAKELIEKIFSHSFEFCYSIGNLKYELPLSGLFAEKFV